MNPDNSSMNPDIAAINPDRTGRARAVVPIALLLLSTHLFSLRAAASPARLSDWSRMPADWKEATVAGDTATLAARKWSFLQSATAPMDVEVSATIAIREPGKLRSFFGESWSVWPDKAVGDEGWDAGLLLRTGESTGYRIQVSATLGEVALVKFPAGGYVRSVPLAVRKDAPLALTARVQANRITVLADGREVLSFLDAEPLPAGKVGIGVHSGAKVEFSQVSVAPITAAKAGKSRPIHPTSGCADGSVGGSGSSIGTSRSSCCPTRLRASSTASSSGPGSGHCSRSTATGMSRPRVPTRRPGTTRPTLRWPAVART
jgi:hypothetical protein